MFFMSSIFLITQAQSNLIFEVSENVTLTLDFWKFDVFKLENIRKKEKLQ